MHCLYLSLISMVLSTKREQNRDKYKAFVPNDTFRPDEKSIRIYPVIFPEDGTWVNWLNQVKDGAEEQDSIICADAKKITSGGSKTIYDVGNGHVLYLSTHPDNDQALRLHEARIAREYNGLLKTPEYKIAQFRLNGERFQCLYAESFETMARRGELVLQIKLLSNIDVFGFSLRLANIFGRRATGPLCFLPLEEQYLRFTDAGFQFPSGKDELHYMLKVNEHGVTEVHAFGFDFDSEPKAMNPEKKWSEVKENATNHIKKMLEKLQIDTE